MRFDPQRHKRRPRPLEALMFSRSAFIARAPEDVFAFCTNGINFARIFPNKVTMAQDTDELTAKHGHVFPFRVWMGPVPLRWEAHIVEFEEGRSFTDEMLGGPLRYWRHTHICAPQEGGTLYTDRVECSTYFGHLWDKAVTRKQLEKLFKYRQQQMKHILESYQE